MLIHIFITIPYTYNTLVILKYRIMNYSTVSNIDRVITLSDCEWLAGFVDGDGHFGHGSSKRSETWVFYLPAEAKNKITLDIVKDICPLGRVSVVKSKQKAANSIYAYRVQSHSGIIQLINTVNGNIRNSIRVPQFINVCNYYKIPFIEAKTLTVDSAWFTGFFDAEGSITMSKTSTAYQITIKVTNKYYENLSPFLDSFQFGKIYFDHSVPAEWKSRVKPSDYTFANTDKYPSNVLSWRVTNERDILTLVKYFERHPPRVPHKNLKILRLVPEFYRLRSIRAYKPNHPEHSNWLNHLSMW